jgi:ACS family hexuronate transporter-like MFS transporter
MKINNSIGIRWRVCALLFFATTINYMDRQIFSILAPTLQTTIGWNESQYGLIVASFTLAYAIGLLCAGRLLDWIGVKKGLGLSVFGWSLAAMGHALASTPIGFAIARIFLGLTEGGNFPAALKTIAEWFPKKERSLATGIFNSGANIGIMIAAFLVPIITLQFGWKIAFLVQGNLGFIWLIFFYTSSPSLPVEKCQNKSKPLPLKKILSQKEALAFIISKFMTDPVWWFYLYWLPKYLTKEHGMTLGTLALPLIIIYIAADIGSIFGGWLSIWFIKQGKSHHEARKLALLTCAFCILPTALLPWVSEMGMAIFLISLAAAGHQGWSANLFNLPSDFFKEHSVASLVGIGGFFGSIGGMFFQAATGYFLEWSGNNYAPIFFICSCAYMTAWIIIQQITARSISNELITNPI